MAIAITEEFNDSRGRLSFYESYDVEETRNINGQSHIDIRSFLDPASSDNVASLNTYSVNDLSTFTVGELTYGPDPETTEAWSSGELWDKRFDDALPVLHFATSPGLANTFSVTSTPIDLQTGFEDDDEISMALPDFPGKFLNLNESFLELSSHPEGLFDVPESKKVFFSESKLSLNDSADIANKEFVVNRSAFAGIDLSKVYGVRVAFQSGYTLDVFIMALRLLSKNWKYGPTDINTTKKVLKKSAPRNGDLSTPFEREEGILWRSGPTLESVPRPINMEVGAMFNSGTFADGTCEINLYFRELTEDFLTQVDLNGLTQDDLQGRVQPDVGDAMYNPRTQDDLEGIPQIAADGIQLNDRTQYDLERTPDYFSASYIFSRFQWNADRTLIQIGTSETPKGDGTGYPYSFAPLKQNTDYVAFTKIEENSARVQLYEVLASGNIQIKLVFDTNTIIDDSFIKRRKGRFGWQASLPTNAVLDSIRSKGEVYAEYRSVQLESETPVVGAELFVQASPDEQLFKTLAPGLSNTPEGSLIQSDTARTTSGLSWRIETTGREPGQGFISNSFLVRDFDNINIDLDIYYPQELINAGVLPKFQIVSESGNRYANLVTTKIFGDQWTHLTFDLPFDEQILPGRYRLAITQQTAKSSKWWIDKVSIRDRVVSWSGRAQAEDAWGTTKPKWQPYLDYKNGENYGIVFPERGRFLQTRAQSFRPDGEINRIQVVPKYAELGRLTFDVDKTYTGRAPIIAMLNPMNFGPNLYGFAAYPLLRNASNEISTYLWYFGDGEVGYGAGVYHRYKSTGTYQVTVVATDIRGNRSSTSKTLTF